MIETAFNPCLSCGACCAFFRASFYWAESTLGRPDGVPEHLTEKLTPHRVMMKGTGGTTPRCVALEGDIGASVRCSIHPLRAGVCRDFHASWQGGEHNPRCDDARARHGLPPLSPEDWETPPLPDLPRAA